MASTVSEQLFGASGPILVSAAAIAVFLAVAGDGFYRWAAHQLFESVLGSNTSPNPG